MPLDYAPPPIRRRSVFVAGLLAHVTASYVIAVAVVVLRSFVAGPPPVAVFLAIALAPLLVPIGFIVPMILAEAVILTPVGAICAYVALSALMYRRLRNQRGT